MDLFERIISNELHQMRINVRKLLQQYTAEAVHDLRVAALRTDFALKFFEESKDIGRARKVRERLKETRRIMGKARNLDIVVLRTKKNLKDLNIVQSQKKSITRLIRSHKQASHQALMKMLRSAQYKQILGDLETIQNQHATTDVSSIIRGPFYKTLTDVLGHERKKIHARNLHKIRITFKKLRYACEFLEDVDKPRLQKALKFIIKFQDMLGDRQDAVTSVELLSKMKDNRMNELIKMERAYIKDCQKKFEKYWKKSFSKSSIIAKLLRWSKASRGF